MRTIFINLIIILFAVNMVFAKECKYCHKEQYNSFQQSIHAKEIGCLDCHQNADTKHGKGFHSSVDCLQCHDSMEGVKNSVHNKVMYNKREGVFECYKCHGSHNILPKNNPLSMVNKGNLKYTCTNCHKEIKGNGFLQFFGKFKISAHEKIYSGIKYTSDNCLNCHHGSVVHGEKNLNPTNCNKCHNKNSAKFHTQTVKAICIYDFIAFIFLIAVILCITSRFYKLKTNLNNKEDE